MKQSQKEFVAELAKLRPSSTFLTLKGYRNDHSEVADFSIVFHMSYANALKKSIAALDQVVTGSLLEKIAKEQLIASYQASLDKMETTPMEALESNYAWFVNEDNQPIKGVKLHIKTQNIHLYGLVNHKKVIVPGIYSERNRQDLTIVKDKLRKLCPVNKFRQFKIVPEQVDSIQVQNLSLLPPE